MIHSTSFILGLIGLSFLLISLLLFLRFNQHKSKWLFALLSGAFCLFLGAALLDNYLNMWDEQYHALVAKHMSWHPFFPTLYEETPLPYDFKLWTANHVWLHKQPLFLWQMALSIKLFGYNEFAVRFPSVIMATLIVYFIFSIGKLLKNERSGFIAALFFSLNYFTYNLVSGYFHTDHNDICFAFYVTASIWAYVKYRHTNDFRYALLVGFLSGCAVLTKWLVGLVVYLGWGSSILFSRLRIKNRKEYKAFLWSLALCCLVFIPWQIYIHLQFPIESGYETKMATLHFTEVIEGHGGNALFHFERIKDLYFDVKWIAFILLIASLMFLFKKGKVTIDRFSIVIMAFAVYLFFTLAHTKMPSFPYFILPVVLLFLASLIDDAWQVIENSKLPSSKLIAFCLGVVLIVFFAVNGFRDNMLYEQHGHLLKNTYRNARLAHSKLYKTIPFNENTIVFNLPPQENAMFMFYTNALGYEFIPDSISCLDLQRKGYDLKLFDSNDLPLYIRNNSKIEIIHPSVWD